jgi:phage baseplate assembly protein W
MSRAAITFPFAVSARGAVAASPRLDVIRQQIEQVLFTMPGERVHRPDFGCGVQRLVFTGAGPETVAAAEYVISTALAKSMGALIAVEAVRVSVVETELMIDILFTARDDGSELHVAVAHPLEGPP